MGVSSSGAAPCDPSLVHVNCRVGVLSRGQRNFRSALAISWSLGSGSRDFNRPQEVADSSPSRKASTPMSRIAAAVFAPRVVGSGVPAEVGNVQIITAMMENADIRRTVRANDERGLGKARACDEVASKLIGCLASGMHPPNASPDLLFFCGDLCRGGGGTASTHGDLTEMTCVTSGACAKRH